jgi:type I restriction enzyme, S subunit
VSELPQGWCEATIDDLADYVSRGRSPKYVAHSDLPVINQRCVRWHGVDEKFVKFVDPSTWHQWDDERIVRRNDILWNSTGTGTIGRAALFTELASYERAVVDSHVTILRAGKAVDPAYLFGFIQSPAIQDRIEDMQSGSTNQVELNRSEIVSTVVPVAPLSEQRRIVAKVDGLTARTARARKELDRIPTLIARYKQRLLALAFAGELTLGWRSANDGLNPVTGRKACDVRSKYSSGENDDFTPPYVIPSNWSWLRLPEIGDLDRGKSRHRPRNDPKLFGGAYPFIQTGDVRAASRVLTEFSSTYSEFGLQQSRLWPIGTVCITIAANIAETAILGIEACFPDSVVGFLPDIDRMSSDYVEYFIRTMRSELEAFAPATAQKNINLNVLSSVRVPVPPKEEQAEIVRRIESAFGWLDRMAADHAAAARLLTKLDAAILTKSFRGELVPQNPNDEPASVLLERIKTEREAKGRKPKGERGRMQNKLKEQVMTGKQPTRELLLKDSEKWPVVGLPFEAIAMRNAMPHDELRDALFELLAGTSPVLRQRFDSDAETIVIQRIAA